MFEDELRARFITPSAVKRIEKELFEIKGSGINMPDLFIINAKDSIESNIEKVLARYYRRNQ